MKIKDSQKASKIALYRKYRPTAFAEVIGQDHIVQVLLAELSADSVSHAYLFSGSRGTGKTSVARILATELGTSASDLYEIDAASNRGIDDIRDLRESVRTLPFDSARKVYIIDEVHMLTKEAFNALLKTLEEPPAHVVFVLATTELDKIPETIRSRCETFLFKKPTLAILKDTISRTAKAEGWTINPDAAELLALLGDGSFRDAQGALQKAMSYAQGAQNTSKSVKADDVCLISRSIVEEATGAPSRQLVHEFIQALAGLHGSYVEADIATEKALDAISKTMAQNVEMKTYLTLIMHTMRNLLLLRYAPNLQSQIETELGVDESAFLLEILKTKSPALSSRALNILLEAAQELRFAFIPSLPLEIAVIRLRESVQVQKSV